MTPAQLQTQYNNVMASIQQKDREAVSEICDFESFELLSSCDDEPVKKQSLAVISTDIKTGLPPSEALIRAREAVIALGYVPGLDAELQVRAGQHDDWLVTQIAYHALVTSDLDIDVLRKYHASGQLALAKHEQRPVFMRQRRSPWNILCTRIANWLIYRFFDSTGERHNAKAKINQLEADNDRLRTKVVNLDTKLSEERRKGGSRDHYELRLLAAQKNARRALEKAQFQMKEQLSSSKLDMHRHAKYTHLREFKKLAGIKAR